MGPGFVAAVLDEEAGRVKKNTQAAERGGVAMHSFRVVLSGADFATLEHASDVFGLGKSELVRRLVRASVDGSPLLSGEGEARLAELSVQVRIVGRNLMQVLHAIHRGEAVGIVESEPVWLGLQEMIATLDDELTAWADASGLASSVLRQRAGLVARNGDAKALVRTGATIASAAIPSPAVVAAAPVGRSSGSFNPAPVPVPVPVTDGAVAE